MQPNKRRAVSSTPGQAVPPSIPPMAAYIFNPPADKITFNSKDSGFSDVFISQNGAEQALDSTTIAHGFKHLAPSYPSHSSFGIFADLTSKFVLKNMVTTAQAHLRSHHSALIKCETLFTPPLKSITSEVEKDQWINHLSTHTLSSLSKRIPKGIKPDRLLDICYTKAIPIHRALWFIKVMCASEVEDTVDSHLAFCSTWTVIVFSFMTKKLNEFNTTTPKSLLIGWKYWYLLLMQY